ncbi:hypothetical protein N2152v2_008145 [Parachlorella kessleri]
MAWFATNMPCPSRSHELVNLIILLLALPSGSLGQWDLTSLTAAEAVEGLCARNFTAVEYNQALLDRIEAFSCLNAFAATDPAKVLADAAAIDAKYERGEDIRPLCGLGFVVKDNIDVAGFVPESSSPIVDRLLDANGVVLGKTRMHELAYGGTSINPVYGPVLNPYNNTCHVGGSSGGTAAIVAARGAPGGFGSDTAGSCRFPAAFNGLVGFRPSLPCWNSGDGCVPMSTTRDTVGALARTVDDVIMFTKVFSDCNETFPQLDLAGLRLGYPTDFWKGLESEAAPVYEAALSALEAAGATLVEFELTPFFEQTLVDGVGGFDLNINYEMPRELARWLYSHKVNISVTELVSKIQTPMAKENLDAAVNFGLDEPGKTPADYFKMVRAIPGLIDEWNALFTTYDFDVVITPTMLVAAKPISQIEPYTYVDGKLVSFLSTYTNMLVFDAALNIPGVSMPVGLTASGMPLGLQLQYKPASNDGYLLAATKAVEAALPSTPPPPFPPACKGCRPSVDFTPKVSYTGVGDPSPTDTTSYYSLRLSGACALADQFPGLSKA